MSNIGLAGAARHLAAELVEFADALEKHQAKRRPRWIGPVSPGVHSERDARPLCAADRGGSSPGCNFA